MADEKVTIGIELDKSDKQKVSNEVTNTFSKAGKNASSSFGSNFRGGLNSSFQKLTSSVFSFKGALVAAGAAFVAVVATFKKGVDAAVIQEDAVNKLNTSLKLTGQFTAETSRDLQTYASELQNASQFGDEAILTNQALLQSMTGLSKDGLKEATQAALDLAEVSGKGLQFAFENVGKAINGTLGPLKDYGLDVELGADKASNFSQVVGGLNERFSGAAASALNTYGGQVTALSNSWGDLFEEIGMFITKSPIVLKLVNGTREAINGVIQKINEFRTGGGFRNLQNDILSVSKVFADVFVRGFERGFKIIGLLVSGLKVSFRGATVALTQIYGEFIKFILDNTPEFILDKLGLENVDGIKESITAFQEEVLLGFNEEVAKTNEGIANLFNDEQTEILLTNIEKSRVALNSLGQQELPKMQKQLKKTTAEAKKSAQTIGQAVAQGIVKVTSLGIQALTQSLILGEDGFRNFGKKIAGILGDMSIQLGQTLILTGIGMKSLFGLDGGGAIIAGAGLIALGTILKSFSSTADTTAATDATGGTGAGNFGAPVSEDPFAEEPDEEERRESTAVNVTIQGDVLDSDESGLRIVELINQAADNTNVTLNQRAFSV